MKSFERVQTGESRAEWDQIGIGRWDGTGHVIRWIEEDVMRSNGIGPEIVSGGSRGQDITGLDLSVGIGSVGKYRLVTSAASLFFTFHYHHSDTFFHISLMSPLLPSQLGPV